MDNKGLLVEQGSDPKAFKIPDKSEVIKPAQEQLQSNTTKEAIANLEKILSDPSLDKKTVELIRSQIIELNTRGMDEGVIPIVPEGLKPNTTSTSAETLADVLNQKIDLVKRVDEPGAGFSDMQALIEMGKKRSGNN